MKLLTSTLAAVAVSAAVAALPVQAAGSNDPLYQAEAPKAFSMVGDLLIARPLLIGATIIGAGVFVVTLPFSAAGGNIGEAGKALVVEPGKEAFVRCLGCTTSGYRRD